MKSVADNTDKMTLACFPTGHVFVNWVSTCHYESVVLSIRSQFLRIIALFLETFLAHFRIFFAQIRSNLFGDRVREAMIE